MNCKAVEPLLSQYIDGDLKDAQEKQVESHLNTCLHCLGEMKALAKVVKGVRGLSSQTPPPGFSQRVMSRIREEAVTPVPLWERLFLPFHIKIPIQAMVLLLVTFLATYLYRTNPLVQEEMKPTTTPAEIPALREDSKLKKKRQLQEKRIDRLKEEDTSILQSRTDIGGKENAPKTSETRNKILLEEEVFQPRSSMESGLRTEQMQVMGDSSTDNEWVLLLNAPTERETLRKKIELLLQDVEGRHLAPQALSDRLRESAVSIDETFWIILPESRLDRFKTALDSLGRIVKDTQNPERQTTSKLKKDSPQLRIKLIIRSPAP